jgi:hypothetical protein
MWKKIKYWLAQRKEEKMMNKMTERAIVSYLHGGPNYAISNVHEVPQLICSVYFEKEEDWVIVDFSQEVAGVVHFIAYTKEKHEEGRNCVQAFIPNARVFMKHFSDGSAGWCFSV